VVRYPQQSGEVLVVEVPCQTMDHLDHRTAIYHYYFGGLLPGFFLFAEAKMYAPAQPLYCLTGGRRVRSLEQLQAGLFSRPLVRLS
jgi:hypothetical protein